MAPSRTPIRCAIYTRQSVEPYDDLSSCQVQFEACLGWITSLRSLSLEVIPQRFDDEGYSGTTLDRPALQRLLTVAASTNWPTIVWIPANNADIASHCQALWIYRSVYGRPGGFPHQGQSSSRNPESRMPFLFLGHSRSPGGAVIVAKSVRRERYPWRHANLKVLFLLHRKICVPDVHRHMPCGVRDPMRFDGSIHSPETSRL